MAVGGIETKGKKEEGEWREEGEERERRKREVERRRREMDAASYRVAKEPRRERVEKRLLSELEKCSAKLFHGSEHLEAIDQTDVKELLLWIQKCLSHGLDEEFFSPITLWQVFSKLPSFLPKSDPVQAYLKQSREVTEKTIWKARVFLLFILQNNCIHDYLSVLCLKLMKCYRKSAFLRQPKFRADFLDYMSRIQQDWIFGHVCAPQEVVPKNELKTESNLFSLFSPTSSLLPPLSPSAFSSPSSSFAPPPPSSSSSSSSTSPSPQENQRNSKNDFSEISLDSPELSRRDNFYLPDSERDHSQQNGTNSAPISRNLRTSTSSSRGRRPSLEDMKGEKKSLKSPHSASVSDISSRPKEPLNKKTFSSSLSSIPSAPGSSGSNIPVDAWAKTIKENPEKAMLLLRKRHFQQFPRLWSATVDYTLTFEERKELTDNYTVLVNSTPENSFEAADVWEDISRLGEKQGQAIFNILRATAQQHPSVGYCQGTVFIASGLQRRIQDEEKSFLCLNFLMEKYFTLKANIPKLEPIPEQPQESQSPELTKIEDLVSNVVPLTLMEEEKERKRERELEKELEREREKKRERQREGGEGGKGVVVRWGDVPIDRQMLLSFYILDRLIEKCLPNFFSHMKHEGINPALFASDWFATLFSRNFSVKFTISVWTMLFFQADRSYLYRIALAILRIMKPQLVRLQMMDLLKHLKQKASNLDPIEVLSNAEDIKIDKRLLDNLQEEYFSPGNYFFEDY